MPHQCRFGFYGYGEKDCELTVCCLLGIYAPGYEERRAQRIKEAYGIDVPSASARTAS